MRNKNDWSHITQTCGKWLCTECSKEYRSKRGLIQHISIAHLKLFDLNLNRVAWNKGMSITTSPDKAESLRAGGKAQHGFRAFGASDYWTDERREAKSAERKKFYEINPSMHPNRLCAGKKSYVQTQLFMHLASIGLRVEQEVRCGSYWIDIVIPEKMIAIEVDGEYFHQHRQDYDDDRSKFICQHYTIIRFPVKRLKQEFCECVAEIVSVAL